MTPLGGLGSVLYRRLQDARSVRADPRGGSAPSLRFDDANWGRVSGDEQRTLEHSPVLPRAPAGGQRLRGKPWGGGGAAEHRPRQA